MQASLTTAERPDQLHPAKVVSTAQAIEAATRTLLTQLEVDNSAGDLLPGSYSQVHLPLPAGVESWRVPSSSLLFRGDGLHLATVDANNVVRLNTVTVGRDFGSEIEILSGIGQEDRVVLNPPDSLLDGAAVKIVAPNGT